MILALLLLAFASIIYLLPLAMLIHDIYTMIQKEDEEI